MIDDARALEAAYARGDVPADRSLACAGAVASRYLAVGTPRSFGVIGAGDDSLAAHRAWFDVDRCEVRTALPDALAADIVCVHAPLALALAQLRRGTHVNALAAIELDDELRRIARIVDERELHAIARGAIDGRQLDEITIFVADA
jgi:ornithine cyclodeaminase/alanine dehydrogenase-like protein (mu-crystallin family)